MPGTLCILRYFLNVPCNDMSANERSEGSGNEGHALDDGDPEGSVIASEIKNVMICDLLLHLFLSERKTIGNRS